MNLPNLITFMRISLIPLFLLAFLTRQEVGGLIAAAIFVVAAATDGVDGYLARKNKEVTRLGKFLDPLADKLLISAALIALVEINHLSTWVAMVIIGREIAVTGLRAIAAADGTVISASGWGKVKTVVQIIFITANILTHALPAGGWLQILLQWITMPSLILAVALTIWSGIDYGMAYYRGLKQPKRERRPLKFRWHLSLRRKSTPKG
jgi:CDP-diacylglycerol--glycerol-3-phosphate 3-phosphatidyltransferase